MIKLKPIKMEIFTRKVKDDLGGGDFAYEYKINCNFQDINFLYQLLENKLGEKLFLKQTNLKEIPDDSILEKYKIDISFSIFDDYSNPDIYIQIFDENNKRYIIDIHDTEIFIDPCGDNIERKIIETQDEFEIFELEYNINK